jgi:nucleoside-diphosphate-sugar epimerase
MNLFILGLGYSATCFARRKLAEGWRVSGTVRGAEKAKALGSEGIEAVTFDARSGDLMKIASRLSETEALLISIPPDGEGDALPERLSSKLVDEARRLRWIGYLSTIGVYGNHGGAWIDERTPCAPSLRRSQARLAAEKSWSALGEKARKPVLIFRLPGIYGPGRNALHALRHQTARRIVKPGQVFNRVHLEDIATALSLSVAKDAESAVYNVTDDEPAPPQDVVAFAAELLGVVPPPEILFAHAKLSPMAASFYGENKRVSNALIKRALGFAPAFPSYREGLRELLRQGEGKT